MEWDAREKLRTRLEEVVRKVLGRADDNFIFSLLCNQEIVGILRRKSPKREMEEQLERLILTADAEERDRFFVKTIQSIQMLTTSRNKSSATSSEVMIAAANLRKLCEQPDILKEFVHKVKVSCPGLEKEVPDFEKALDALIHIPINRLKSPKEVLTFLDDLIQSGGASQSEQGLVFVLGNTNAGKTSLVDTFVGYAADPSKKPAPHLTKPGDGKIETEVLEFYEGLALKPEKTFKVDLVSRHAPVTASLKEDAAELKLNIIDMGRYCIV